MASRDSTRRPSRRDPRSGEKRLPRFASRRPARPGWTAARLFELVHKLLTAGAALAALVKALL